LSSNLLQRIAALLCRLFAPVVVYGDMDQSYLHSFPTRRSSSTLYFDSLTVNAGNGGFLHCIQMDTSVNAANQVDRCIHLNAMKKTTDRKSGSAGMPRPTSYAVFCLKKQNIIIDNNMTNIQR